jgi:hypothetical protein
VDAGGSLKMILKVDDRVGSVTADTRLGQTRTHPAPDHTGLETYRWYKSRPQL